MSYLNRLSCHYKREESTPKVFKEVWKMITKISENELMQSFYNMLPYFKYIVGEEVGFTMSNTQNFLLVRNTDTLKINFSAGDAIPKGSAADICLQKKEVIDVVIPEKVFGFAVRTIGIPVFEKGQIAGTMVISFSADRFRQISRLSELLSGELQTVIRDMENMNHVFGNIRETNQRLQGKVEDTREDYKKTDEVLNFINGVAKKTNLLGLNASIEAARAGTAGRGFSVVSNEIGKLSISTKESVVQISRITNHIRSEIDSVYSEFEKSNELLTEQTAVLDEMRKVLEEVSQNAQSLLKYTKKGKE